MSPHRMRVSVYCVSAVLTWLLLFAFQGCANADSGRASDVRNAIRNAGNYLVHITQDDGMFEYRINTDPDVRVSEGYNILRHGGGVYALGMYNGYKSDRRVVDAIERSANYLIDQAIHEVPEADSCYAVWSRPDVNRKDGPLEAKLGGTGLGLVALISALDVKKGLISTEELRNLARFIEFMQKDDGSFYSKYILEEGGRDDSWTSLYYPGEAALGLVMLYEVDNDPRWIKCANRALEYLARSRQGRSRVEADHWALLATGRLLAIDRVEQYGVDSDLLIAHAKQVCRSIMSAQVTNSDNPDYQGGFTSDGRTTPTATRLEGLLAAMTFIPRSDPLFPEMAEAVELGITFLLNAQIDDGDYAGAYTRATALLDGDSPEVRTFNRRATEIRVDYVQHALSALIQYDALK